DAISDDRALRRGAGRRSKRSYQATRARRR
ncbi:MAG: hypothetical protein AVDCRST_MAG91-2617, partial [uncultured Sphingomonadaceae bacterium]